MSNAHLRYHRETHLYKCRLRGGTQSNFRRFAGWKRSRAGNVSTGRATGIRRTIFSSSSSLIWVLFRYYENDSEKRTHKPRSPEQRYNVYLSIELGHTRRRNRYENDRVQLTALIKPSRQSQNDTESNVKNYGFNVETLKIAWKSSRIDEIHIDVYRHIDIYTYRR